MSAKLKNLDLKVLSQFYRERSDNYGLIYSLLPLLPATKFYGKIKISPIVKSLNPCYLKNTLLEMYFQHGRTGAIILEAC